MKMEWQLWENRFNKETCDQIISLAKEIPEQESVVGSDNQAKTNESIRKSKVRWLHKTMPQFKELHETLVDMFHISNRNAYGVDLSDVFEMQFTEYRSEEKGFYSWHIDTQFESVMASHRKLSMVVQLSDPDDYEGGEFEFNSLMLGAPPQEKLKKQGNVLIFPSFVLHRVTPVTKGTRYSLVTWMEGPKWR